MVLAGAEGPQAAVPRTTRNSSWLRFTCACHRMGLRTYARKSFQTASDSTCGAECVKKNTNEAAKILSGRDRFEEELRQRVAQRPDGLGAVDIRAQQRAAFQTLRIPGTQRAQLVDHPLVVRRSRRRRRGVRSQV